MLITYQLNPRQIKGEHVTPAGWICRDVSASESILRRERGGWDIVTGPASRTLDGGDKAAQGHMAERRAIGLQLLSTALPTFHSTRLAMIKPLVEQCSAPGDACFGLTDLNAQPTTCR